MGGRARERRRILTVFGGADGFRVAASTPELARRYVERERRRADASCRAENPDLLTLISGQQTRGSKIEPVTSLNPGLDRTTTNARRPGDGGSLTLRIRKLLKSSPVRSAVGVPTLI